MTVQVAGRLADIFELEAPIPDVEALLNQRRAAARRRDLKLGERSLMLTPLALLAACGGGGGGGPQPIPSPPPTGGTPTPSPAPTPSPSPTPSPTPTPTPTPTPAPGATIDLGALGSAGATIAAPVSGAQFGFAIATVQPGQTGDVVGDASADLVISAPFGANGTGPGQVFIFSGASLTGGAARTLNGSTAGDRFGFDVAVGDIGGSARGDVLVGAPGFIDGTANSGRVFAFLGDGSANNATPGPVGANGFTLTINGSGDGLVAFPNGTGNLGPNLGAAVAVLGDVNGDGRNDFFVTTPGLNENGVIDQGDAFVGFGQTSYPGATVGVGTLGTPGQGFRVLGDAVTDGEGYTAAASGQINGAGGADLVLADARAGVVGVRFGNATPSGTLTVSNNTDLTGANGVRLTSAEANARFGESVAVGDINGDGLADVIVGAPGVSKVYILLGAASYAGGSINVASPGGAAVIEIAGTGSFGSSVAFVGNFNGDARGDFVVGAPGDGASGSAYILLGSATPSATSLSLAGGNAIKLSGGAAGTGAEVAGPGDLNGDGLADVAIGAVNASSNTTGTVYVVFGRSSQASSSVGQEAVGLDDGTGELFGGSASASASTIDPMLAASDMPPNELFI